MCPRGRPRGLHLCLSLSVVTQGRLVLGQQMYSTHQCVLESRATEREGRGYNDPGAHEAAHGLKGAHQMTFRNEHVRPSFWRSPDFE